MASGPRVGYPAPVLTLRDTGGTFRQADHRGRRVVSLFHPGDETAACTRQLRSYRDPGDGA